MLPIFNDAHCDVIVSLALLLGPLPQTHTYIHTYIQTHTKTRTLRSNTMYQFSLEVSLLFTFVIEIPMKCFAHFDFNLIKIKTKWRNTNIQINVCIACMCALAIKSNAGIGNSFCYVYRNFCFHFHFNICLYICISKAINHSCCTIVTRKMCRKCIFKQLVGIQGPFKYLSIMIRNLLIAKRLANIACVFWLFNVIFKRISYRLPFISEI